MGLEVLKKEKPTDIVVDSNVKGAYKLSSDEAKARKENTVPVSEKKKTAVSPYGEG